MSALKISSVGDLVEIARGNVSVRVSFHGVEPPKEPQKTLIPQPRKQGTRLPPDRPQPGVLQTLNLPLDAKGVKPHRPGTRRAKLVSLLRRGSTIDRIMKETGWNRNDAREAVRQMHRDLGYGVQEGKGGKLTLLEPTPR